MHMDKDGEIAQSFEAKSVLWDIPWWPELPTLAPKFFEHASGVVFVYDTTNIESFRNI
jgi:GTPase SAR1 family protein